MSFKVPPNDPIVQVPRSVLYRIIDTFEEQAQYEDDDENFYTQFIAILSDCIKSSAKPLALADVRVGLEITWSAPHDGAVQIIDEIALVQGKWLTTQSGLRFEYVRDVGKWRQRMPNGESGGDIQIFAE